MRIRSRNLTTFRAMRIKSRFCSQIGQASLFEGADKNNVEAGSF